MMYRVRRRVARITLLEARGVRKGAFSRAAATMD